MGHGDSFGLTNHRRAQVREVRPSSERIIVQRGAHLNPYGTYELMPTKRENYLELHVYCVHSNPEGDICVAVLVKSGDDVQVIKLQLMNYL